MASAAFTTDRRNGLAREEWAALALVLAAHAGVVALLVMHPAAPPPPPPARMEVTLADDVGLQDTSPSTGPAATQIATKLGEAPPAPAPGPEPAPKAETVPEPAPKPSAAPLPGPLPKPRPAPKTHASASADPIAAALAASALAHHARTPPPKNPGAHRIGADFLKGMTDANTQGQAAVAPAAITGAVRASLAAAISRQLKPNWTAPQGADADQLVTILSFDLNPDGSLAGAPRLVRQEGIDESNRPQAPIHLENAIRAVRAAAPFPLPPQYYSAWKHVSAFRFDRNTSQ